MEKQKYDRWNLNNIKAMVRVAYEAGVLQAQKTPGKCSYYEDGYRCAVGQILTGEEIDELKDRNDLKSDLIFIKFWLGYKGCTIEAFNLLSDLQAAHDYWSRRDGDDAEEYFLKLLEFEKVEAE